MLEGKVRHQQIQCLVGTHWFIDGWFPTVSSQGRRGNKPVFFKGIISFMRAPPSQPNYLPKPPPLITIMGGSRFNIWIWGRYKHSICGAHTPPTYSLTHSRCTSLDAYFPSFSSLTETFSYKECLPRKLIYLLIHMLFQLLIPVCSCES